MVVGAGINGVGHRPATPHCAACGSPCWSRTTSAAGCPRGRAGSSTADCATWSSTTSPRARVAARARTAVPARPAPGEAGAADGAHLRPQPPAAVDGPSWAWCLRRAVAATRRPAATRSSTRAGITAPLHRHRPPTASPARRCSTTGRSRPRSGCAWSSRSTAAGGGAVIAHEDARGRAAHRERPRGRGPRHRPADRGAARGARAARLQRRRARRSTALPAGDGIPPQPRLNGGTKGSSPDRRPVPRRADRRRLLRVPARRAAGADHPLDGPLHDRHHRHPVRRRPGRRAVRHRRGRLPARRGQHADPGGEPHPGRRALHLSAACGRCPTCRTRPSRRAAQPRAARARRRPGAGLVTVVGGKLTTYRQLAEDAVDDAFKRLGRKAPKCADAQAAVHRRPIADVRAAAGGLACGGLPARSADRLVDLYGSRAFRRRGSSRESRSRAARRFDPDSGAIGAELVFAVATSSPASLADVLARRVLLAFEPGHGLESVERAAEMLGAELGWDDDRRKEEIAEYQRLASGVPDPRPRRRARCDVDAGSRDGARPRGRRAPARCSSTRRGASSARPGNRSSRCSRARAGWSSTRSRCGPTQLDSAKRALARPGRPRPTSPRSAFTSHRETAFAWDRGTGAPVHNGIMWMSHQTDDIVRRWRAEGLDPEVRARTGLNNDSYFSAPKVAWLHGERRRVRRAGPTRRDRRRHRRHAGCCGTSPGAARTLTDHTQASRTALLNLAELGWDAALLAACGIPAEILPPGRCLRQPISATSTRGCSAGTPGRASRSPGSSPTSRPACSGRRASGSAPRRTRSARPGCSSPTSATSRS